MPRPRRRCYPKAAPRATGQAPGRGPRNPRPERGRPEALADRERLDRLARRIVADILAVGSLATAGPALNAAQEAELLHAVETRLLALLPHHGGDDDAALHARFRDAHPELFSGDPASRHRAATTRGRDAPPRG